MSRLIASAKTKIKREDNFINVAKHARALTMIEVLRCQRDAAVLVYSYGWKCRRSAARHLINSKNLKDEWPA